MVNMLMVLKLLSISMDRHSLQYVKKYITRLKRLFKLEGRIIDLLEAFLIQFIFI